MRELDGLIVFSDYSEFTFPFILMNTVDMWWDTKAILFFEEKVQKLHWNGWLAEWDFWLRINNVSFMPVRNGQYLQAKVPDFRPKW